jgi:hypothetical protein
VGAAARIARARAVVIGQGVTVPLHEAECRRGADFVRKGIGEKAMGDLRAVGLSILGRPVGRDDAGDGLADNLAIRPEIVDRAAHFKSVAEVLIEPREQRVDHNDNP